MPKVYEKTFADGRRAEVLLMAYGKGRIVLVDRMNPMCNEDEW
jgi:hypothetical protein